MVKTIKAKEAAKEPKAKKVKKSKAKQAKKPEIVKAEEPEIVEVKPPAKAPPATKKPKAKEAIPALLKAITELVEEPEMANAPNRFSQLYDDEVKAMKIVSPNLACIERIRTRFPGFAIDPRLTVIMQHVGKPNDSAKRIPKFSPFVLPARYLVASATYCHQFAFTLYNFLVRDKMKLNMIGIFPNTDHWCFQCPIYFVLECDGHFICMAGTSNNLDTLLYSVFMPHQAGKCLLRRNVLCNSDILDYSCKYQWDAKLYPEGVGHVAHAIDWLLMTLQGIPLAEPYILDGTPDIPVCSKAPPAAIEAPPVCPKLRPAAKAPPAVVEAPPAAIEAPPAISKGPSLKFYMLKLPRVERCLPTTFQTNVPSSYNNTRNSNWLNWRFENPMYKFAVVENHGQGHCLYLSLIHAIKPIYAPFGTATEMECVVVLRDIVASAITQEMFDRVMLAKVEPGACSIEDHVTTLAQYQDYIRTTDCYADALAMALLEAHFDIQFAIINLNTNAMWFMQTMSNKHIVMLAYSGKDHYEANHYEVITYTQYSNIAYSMFTPETLPFVVRQAFTAHQ